MSKLSKPIVSIVDPLIGISAKGITLAQDILDMDMEDASEVEDLMKDYMGEHIHARVAFTPFLGFKLDRVGFMLTGLVQ